MEAGIQPDALAGFSLGEISALAFSGAVSLEDGFRLVCRRGEADAGGLQRGGLRHGGCGQADPLRKWRSWLSQFDQVYPVNYNSPAQTVCAGLSSSMDGFKAAVKEASGRALPLKVSGAFHSPFMASAAEGAEAGALRHGLRRPLLPALLQRDRPAL